jgi:hypothetical protein
MTSSIMPSSLETLFPAEYSSFLDVADIQQHVIGDFGQVQLPLVVGSVPRSAMILVEFQPALYVSHETILQIKSILGVPLEDLSNLTAKSFYTLEETLVLLFFENCVYL